MSVNNEKQAFTPMSVETELSLYCDLIDLIERYSNCSHIISPHLSERLRKYIKENPEKFEEERSKAETDAEYAIIISVSALILSFLAFLFSLAKG